MRLKGTLKRNLPRLDKESKKNLFWHRLFGFKVGDIVRPKYGKCYWEVYAYDPSWDMLKVRRLRCDKYGCFTPEEVTTTFWSWQIEEVVERERIRDVFPSQVFK